MPKRSDLRRILIIGSGPIVIGQACEFDYSGTQAAKVLKKEGFQVILVNSNPATIMTDPELADRTYIEPLTVPFLEKIIERERPDAILPTMGGQTALNLTLQLDQAGILKKYQVELIGAGIEAIQKAENRQSFAETMRAIGLPIPIGAVVHSMVEAMEFLNTVKFPLIIRPSFTLGGSGGNVAYNMDEYRCMVEWGLTESPTRELLIEESILGWKEFELEVMRDRRDQVVIVCSIENLDPMGIHTGDSITVAPAQTLSDMEYQRLRDYSISIIRAIGVDTGGSNIQFAINPANGDVRVIEMNPRVSRSSALASKATGFPIAKIAALLAIGYTLDEITNEITGKTPACFEPSLDYVVVKIPRFNFEKFPDTPPILTTQMKSVGEVMSLGRTFNEAFQKALRSLETGRAGFGADGKDPFAIDKMDDKKRAALCEILREHIQKPYWDRIFYVKYALEAGISREEIYQLTAIDPWFLSHFEKLISLEREIRRFNGHDDEMPVELLRRAKQNGFSDKQLAYLLGSDEAIMRNRRYALKIRPVYKMVDTCAGEFAARTAYYYSSYDEENESIPSSKPKVIVLGGGPNRIGQGIEFDYCCVHCVATIRDMGYEAIMINSNPETVSTDYDISDKLYFEPLTFEDVMHIVELEQPIGVVVQFGGQTPLKLAQLLNAAGVPILGTSYAMIDLAENRERFGKLLRELGIDYPAFRTAMTADELLREAESVGYPVLLRPSYVLGGRAMRIVYDTESLKEYAAEELKVTPEHPVIIDRFLEDAFEFDVDAISDGEQVLIGGVMQHIEEAGIHSGDSAAVLPAYMISPKHEILIREYTRRLARRLNVKGLVNLQFALKDDVLYVIEVNPRASRTVPFVSKAVGLPLARIATQVILGKRLNGFEDLQERIPPYFSVKECVLPFHKFPGTPRHLGPEMRSTGEVMGISPTFGNAFAKAQLAVHDYFPVEGAVLLSVHDNDQKMIVPIARNFALLGFKLFATRGTAQALRIQGLDVEEVRKVSESSPNIIDYIREKKFDLIINTPLGKDSRQSEASIGIEAFKHRILLITTLSGALAALSGIEAMRLGQWNVYSLQELHQKQPARLMV